MHPYFEILTPRWFKRAFVYTGSIGEFRYRFVNDRENSLIHAAVYTHFCYERAKDVQNALLCNLKLMKRALTKEQYGKYVALINVTRANQPKAISSPDLEAYLAEK